MIFSNFSFLNFIILNIKKSLTGKHLVTGTRNIFSFFSFFSSFLHVSFFSLSLVSLTGCIGMGSKFDCNVDSGGRCAPMNHINKLANYGVFNERSHKNNRDEIDKIDKMMLTERKGNKSQKIYGTTPIRSNEKIQQIWIGPHEDTNGNYHEGNYVYVVVKKSKWVNK